MNAWWLAVVVAGGAGAVVRMLLGLAIPPLGTAGLPLATMVINVSGSLLLGLATGLAAEHLLPVEWRLVISTGFLGGYTTFSTASTDATRLLQTDHKPLAVLYAGGMLLLSVAGAGLGLWIGHSVA